MKKIISSNTFETFPSAVFSRRYTSEYIAQCAHSVRAFPTTVDGSTQYLIQVRNRAQWPTEIRFFEDVINVVNEPCGAHFLAFLKDLHTQSFSFAMQKINMASAGYDPRQTRLVQLMPVVCDLKVGTVDRAKLSYLLPLTQFFFDICGYFDHMSPSAKLIFLEICRKIKGPLNAEGMDQTNEGSLLKLGVTRQHIPSSHVAEWKQIANFLRSMPKPVRTLLIDRVERLLTLFSKKKLEKNYGVTQQSTTASKSILQTHASFMFIESLFRVPQNNVHLAIDMQKGLIDAFGKDARTNFYVDLQFVKKGVPAALWDMEYLEVAFEQMMALDAFDAIGYIYDCFAQEIGHPTLPFFAVDEHGNAVYKASGRRSITLPGIRQNGRKVHVPIQQGFGRDKLMLFLCDTMFKKVFQASESGRAMMLEQAHHSHDPKALELMAKALIDMKVYKEALLVISRLPNLLKRKMQVLYLSAAQQDTSVAAGSAKMTSGSGKVVKSKKKHTGKKAKKAKKHKGAKAIKAGKCPSSVKTTETKQSQTDPVTMFHNMFGGYRGIQVGVFLQYNRNNGIRKALQLTKQLMEEATQFTTSAMAAQASTRMQTSAKMPTSAQTKALTQTLVSSQPQASTQTGISAQPQASTQTGISAQTHAPSQEALEECAEAVVFYFMHGHKSHADTFVAQATPQLRAAIALKLLETQFLDSCLSVLKLPISGPLVSQIFEKAIEQEAFDVAANIVKYAEEASEPEAKRMLDVLIQNNRFDVVVRVAPTLQNISLQVHVFEALKESAPGYAGDYIKDLFQSQDMSEAANNWIFLKSLELLDVVDHMGSKEKSTILPKLTEIVDVVSKHLSIIGTDNGGKTVAELAALFARLGFDQQSIVCMQGETSVDAIQQVSIELLKGRSFYVASLLSGFLNVNSGAIEALHEQCIGALALFKEHQLRLGQDVKSGGSSQNDVEDHTDVFSEQAEYIPQIQAALETYLVNSNQTKMHDMIDKMAGLSASTTGDVSPRSLNDLCFLFVVASCSRDSDDIRRVVDVFSRFNIDLGIDLVIHLINRVEADSDLLTNHIQIIVDALYTLTFSDFPGKNTHFGRQVAKAMAFLKQNIEELSQLRIGQVAEILAKYCQPNDAIKVLDAVSDAYDLLPTFGELVERHEMNALNMFYVIRQKIEHSDGTSTRPEPFIEPVKQLLSKMTSKKDHDKFDQRAVTKGIKDLTAFLGG